ncbi:MAG: response regulator transcription factor [Ignavibacteriaceae bacterium]
MINILIADDHPIVRRGLKQIIQDEKDMKVVCEAANSEEVMIGLKTTMIDILLLDISMPGKSGLELLSDLNNQYPNLKILILSAMPEEAYAKRVIKMGAFGYIHKESAPDLLVPAIRRVLKGKRYISSKLADILASDLTEKEKDILHEQLSEREFEVLLLIGKAKTPTEIAETLHLGVTTVSTYRSRILDKMKMKNNSELIQYCFRHNLID